MSKRESNRAVNGLQLMAGWPNPQSEPPASDAVGRGKNFPKIMRIVIDGSRIYAYSSPIRRQLTQREMK